MKNKFIYLAIIAAGFVSCEPEFENSVDANYTSEMLIFHPMLQLVIH